MSEADPEPTFDLLSSRPKGGHSYQLSSTCLSLCLGRLRRLLRLRNVRIIGNNVMAWAVLPGRAHTGHSSVESQSGLTL